MQLIAKAKRRRLGRLVSVHVVAGFAMIEGADILVDAFSLTPAIVPVVATAVFGALPLMIVIQWRSEIGLPFLPVEDRESVSRVETVIGEAEPGSIAVLPFVDFSAGDDDVGYFGEGMAEELLNGLAQVEGVKVASRTSSFFLHSQGADVERIGQRLRVRNVLEGSVRTAGQRMRIHAQLVDAETGYHLWSDIFDREVEDIFAVQDEIARAIIRALPLSVGDTDRYEIRGRGTENTEAYDIYIRGRHAWYNRQISQALEYFEQAVASDPDYALAHSGISDATSVLAHYGFVPSMAAYQRSRRAAERAVELDPYLGEARCSLGISDTYYGWDFRSAERNYRIALELNPRIALAHAWMGIHLAWSGRAGEGIAEAKSALGLEPLSSLIHCTTSIAQFYGRRFEDAIETCRRGLEFDPEFGPLKWCLSVALTEVGEHDEAIAAMEESARLMRDAPWVVMLLGAAHARAGDRAEAERVYGELVTRSKTSYVPELSLGFIRLQLGDLDEAHHRLKRAFADRNAMAWFFGNWPGVPEKCVDPQWSDLFHGAGVVSLGDHPHMAARSGST